MERGRGGGGGVGAFGRVLPTESFETCSMSQQATRTGGLNKNPPNTENLLGFFGFLFFLGGGGGGGGGGGYRL